MKKATHILIVLLCLVIAKPLSVRGDDPSVASPLPISGGPLMTVSEKGESILDKENLPWALSIPAGYFLHNSYSLFEKLKEMRRIALEDHAKNVKDLGNSDAVLANLDSLIREAEKSLAEAQPSVKLLKEHLNKKVPGKPTVYTGIKNLPELMQWLEVSEGKKWREGEGKAWFEKYSELMDRATYRVALRVNAAHREANKMLEGVDHYPPIRPRSGGEEPGAFMTDRTARPKFKSTSDLKDGLIGLRSHCREREAQLGLAVEEGKKLLGANAGRKHYWGRTTPESRQFTSQLALGGALAGSIGPLKLWFELDKAHAHQLARAAMMNDARVRFENDLDKSENKDFKTALQKLLQMSLLAHEEEIVESFKKGLTEKQNKQFDVKAFVHLKIHSQEIMDLSFRGSVPKVSIDQGYINPGTVNQMIDNAKKNGNMVDTALSKFSKDLYPEFYDRVFAGLIEVMLASPHEVLDDEVQVKVIRSFKSGVLNAQGIKASKPEDVLPSPGTKTHSGEKTTADNKKTNRVEPAPELPANSLEGSFAPASGALNGISTAMRLPNAADANEKMPEDVAPIQHK
jgi:hypothetical protein